MEFKYLSLKQLGMRGQVLQQLSTDECRALKPVQKALAEATEQLQRYAACVQGEYKNKLNLRTYAIIALGLECFIWHEIL